MSFSSKAPVTQILLAINILIHIYVYVVVYSPQGIDFENFMYTYGLVPAEFWLAASWWQPFTCLFLHAGLLHLTVNMLALWSLGASFGCISFPA